MKSAYVLGALVGACLLTYANTLKGRFIYDDIPIIVRNPMIQKLDRIPQLFKSTYWGMYSGQPEEFKGTLYRPLTMATFALNYNAGRLDPWGYHAVNIALHLCVSLLLWILCLKLGWSPWAAAISALLFALLPVHTEAVSSIVGRSEVLAACFVLASWILVAQEPHGPGIFLGAACFALALLSKENAAAFLPVLILSDFTIRQEPWHELWRKRLRVWLFYGGCFLLYLAWRTHLVGSILDAGGMSYFTDQSLVIRGLTLAPFILRHYLGPLLLGVGFCADFTRPVYPDAQLQNPIAIVSVLFLLALLGYAAWATLYAKDKRTLCILFFFGLLLPVMHLVARLEVIGAERFLYLPSIGYCMALGLLIDNAYHSKKEFARWTGVGFIGLCLWYGMQTLNRNLIWQTEESFWTATLHDAPQSPRAWNGLGLVRMEQKKYDEAMEMFNKALGLNRMLLDADYNMATCFFLKGNYKVAKRGYLYVAERKPYDPATLFHLALLSEKEKDYQGAENYYAAMLRVDPLNQTAQSNLDRMKGIKQRVAEVRP